MHLFAKVRGAPAIAIVGCLSLAIELGKTNFETVEELKKFTIEKLNYLITARPTAINMKNAAADLKTLIEHSKDINVDSLKRKYITNIFY